MAVISTPSGVPTVTVRDAATHHYKFVGVVFKRRVGNTVHPSSSLVDITDPTPTTAQNPWIDVAGVPHHFIFDRCVFSNIPNIGDPNNPPQTNNLFWRRGIALNTANASVINSSFKEFKDPNTDAQAIGSFSSIGPHAIINNHLEGAAECIIWGGDWTHYRYISPSDIVVRGNYLFKPLRWATELVLRTCDPGETPPCYRLLPTKNIFELKHAKNVIVDGNVLQNSFFNTTTNNDAFVITVRNETYEVIGNQSVNTGKIVWATIQNAQITNNKVDHAVKGVNIIGKDNERPDPPQRDSIPARNLIIRNNLFNDLYGPVQSHFLQVGNFPIKLWVNHNTVNSSNTRLFAAYGPALIGVDSQFRYDDNVAENRDYGFTAIVDDVSVVDHAKFLLNTYAPGWLIRRNVISFSDGKQPFISQYPTTSNENDLNFNRYFCPTLCNPVGEFQNLFVDYSRGDYRLNDVPFGGYNRATDGTDVGCDVRGTTSNPESKLILATAGARAGIWTTVEGVTKLADDFNDLKMDNLVWVQEAVYQNSSQITVAEQNNQLEIVYPSETLASYNGYRAIYPLDFTNAFASVQAKQVIGLSTGENWLVTYLDSANLYRFGVREESGALKLVAVKRDGNVDTDVFSIAYVSTQHLYWRIRHRTSDNNMVFETSTNGNSWTERGNVANPFATTGMRVGIMAGVRVPQISYTASTAIFDNLKVSR
jgi:hypothetical protein